MSERDEQTNYELGGLADRLAGIRARIDAAALRSGRRPEDVALVAVSKTHPAAAIEAALAAGQRVFGESRIQEALPKIEAIKAPGVAGAPAAPAEWHLIGHLQSNKVNQAVGRFALLHAVDSARLVEALERRAAALGLVQSILIEVNVSGEGSKFGVAPEGLPEVIEALERSPHLRGEGLMTIPPDLDDPELVRPFFARLRALSQALTGLTRFTPRHLSMGMSGDFEVAIEEGATLVRIGTAIFGDRDHR